MGKQHWTDKKHHVTHAWAVDGHCLGCGMHFTWPGARTACTGEPKARAKRSEATKLKVLLALPREEIE